MAEPVFVHIVDGLIVGLKERDPDRLYRSVTIRSVHVELSPEEEAKKRQDWARIEKIKELTMGGATREEATDRVLREGH